MGLGIPTQLTINTHKCSYGDVYARIQALIRDDYSQWRNEEASKGEGETETKDRDVEFLLDAPERDSEPV